MQLPVLWIARICTEKCGLSLCPFDAAGNLEKKNQIHLRFVFVNGKKEIRETQREREREREREMCGFVGRSAVGTL
jgi:hypothetical protein